MNPRIASYLKMLDLEFQLSEDIYEAGAKCLVCGAMWKWYGPAVPMGLGDLRGLMEHSKTHNFRSTHSPSP